MGMNIIVYSQAQDKLELVLWWDTARHYGDTWFANSHSFDRKNIDDTEVCRPSSPEQCISSIKSSGYSPNIQRRLIGLVERLNKEPNLWIEFSY